MKNKDRIESLEHQIEHLSMHIEVLLNRVAILELKANPKVPASAPPEWPSWKPFWAKGPGIQNPKYTITAAGTPVTRIVPMMEAQCRYHH